MVISYTQPASKTKSFGIVSLRLLESYREGILSGEITQDEEEFLLTTYDKYKPEGLKVVKSLSVTRRRLFSKGIFVLRNTVFNRLSRLKFDTT